MRTSIALVLSGHVLALAGLCLWSVPLALVLLGTELGTIGLLREARSKPAMRRPAPAGIHRRRAVLRRWTDRARPKHKLIRGAA